MTVKIGTISVEQKHLVPVVKLHDITVLNDTQTAVLTKAKELAIGIDILKSISSFKLEPRFIRLSDTHLSLYQSATGEIIIIDPSLPPPTLTKSSTAPVASLEDLLDFLAGPKRISLNNIDFEWHDALQNKFTIHIDDLSLHTQRRESLPKNIDPNIIISDHPITFGFDISLPKDALHFQISDKPELTTWLSHAFQNEDNLSGTITLYGLFKKGQPFNYQTDKFLAIMTLENANLLYRSGWPDLENMSANLIFDGKSLEIFSELGLIGGIPFQQLKANINNFTEPMLHIDGLVKTDMPAGLNFVANSPLKNGIGQDLEGMVLQGALDLNLKLDIPLFGNDREAKVNGVINLQDNILSVANQKLNIKNLQGLVNFTESTLTAPLLTGEIDRQKTSIDVKTIDPGTAQRITQIQIAGNTDIKTLEPIIPFFSSIQGKTDYKATMQLHRKTSNLSNSIIFNSDLQGLAINLPPPLQKSANSSKTLKLSLSFKKNKAQSLSINYDNDTQADILFNYKKVSSLTPSLSSLTPEAVELEQPILDINANLSHFTWSEWAEYFADYLNQSEHSVKNLLLTPGPMIKKVTAHVSTFKIFGQTLQATDITFNQDQDNKKMVATISSPTIIGTITRFYGQPLQPVTASFNKLYLQTSETNSSTIKPGELPPLNITSNDFRYNTNNLGQIELKTTPSVTNKNLLNIKTLNIINDKFTLTTNGRWQLLENHKEETNLTGKISTKSLGDLLKYWNTGDNLIGGSGAATFSLSWPKAFFSPDFMNLDGHVNLNFTKGRIVNLSSKAEEQLGIGRFLSLLSLQSLPRRLTLDFSDLVTKGFTFDTMAGNLELNDSNIYSKNLILEGPVARVITQGKIGLKTKDYDLKLVVSPNITSSLPIVAAIALNPVAGIATWAADRIFSYEMSRGGNDVYSIKGSWEKPEVSKTTLPKKQKQNLH